ncbi:MAG TPA: cupin domain-containing protein [Allosphingosinicella sp.]|nr:cupin domain-containing protein [Allosphingosinicella sp.]
MRSHRLAAIALALAGAIALPAQAPRPPGSTRTDLQRHDLSIAGWESIQARIDFAPGARFPMHRHPGEEIIYVLQGTLDYQLEGRPPVRLEAGQVLFVPAGVYHSAHNPGSTPGSELATYVVEKGRPLVTFAP